MSATIALAYAPVHKPGPIAKLAELARTAAERYMDFLRAKICLSTEDGFEVEDWEINPLLKPHQRDIVKWACRGGRRAIFAAFGLGKSFIQLEIIRLCLRKFSRGRGLIVLPLGVRTEFFADAAKLDISVRFVQSDDEVAGPGIYLTNYESVRDGKLSPALFDAASLDEASVLRSFGSKTYQTFTKIFESVRYLFAATATPSPNRFKELIHYGGFLRIMQTGEALTRFFQRDSTQANNLTLYPHMERQFWLWMSSWACFIQMPSDLGYSDEGYELPELKVIYHEVESDHTQAHVERNGQARLFADAAMGLPAAAAEKRRSLPARMAKLKEILAASPEDHFILWHDLEDERHAIQEAVPKATAVWGTQKLEEKERRVIAFANGEVQYLATKPEISGSGCNFQRHCHKCAFVGIGYKFNDFIQAIHRIYRFLQTKECEIHVIYSDAEREVLRVLLEKWGQHKELVQQMTDIIREYGLGALSLAELLARSLGVERSVVSSRTETEHGPLWSLAHNDCVLEAQRLADNSVGLVVTSIPFANHYEYTPDYADMGHTEDNDHFWRQMDFLTPELMRALQPGRLACIHVKDRINFGNVTGEGVPTVSPFHAECLFHGLKHGFQYLGMITVTTDVVRENNQTYRLGWSENCKDGTKMGVGSPEYILLFRKPQTDKSKGYADIPVVKSKEVYTRARWQVDADAFWRSSGDRLLSVEEMASFGPAKLATIFTKYSLDKVYDYHYHVQVGQELEIRDVLPSTFASLAPGSTDPNVWSDVNRMRTLNANQTQAGRENHICPLQLDIVERLIERYSNEGDLVYDPFCGLGTVPKTAVEMSRRGGGSELNAGYFADSLTYMRAAEEKATMPSFFDVLQAEEEPVEAAA